MTEQEHGSVAIGDTPSPSDYVLVYVAYDGELFSSKEAVQEYCRDRGYQLGMMGWTTKTIHGPAPAVKELPAEAVFDVAPAEACEPALRTPAVGQREVKSNTYNGAEIFVKCRNFLQAAPLRDVKERKE